MGLLGIIMRRGSIIEILSCAVSAAIIVFLVMPIHEYAHGFAAGKLGDPTPKWQGRMTLNPMAHVDYLGALMIFLVGFGWAKPVEIDARNFKNPKRDMALTALAGPVSNIIFAFISSLLRSFILFLMFKFGHLENEYFMFSRMGQIPKSYWLVILFLIDLVLQYVTIINLSLAIFNLIPIPPLDGSKILGAILPDRIYYSIMRYERILTLGLLLLLLVGSGISSFLGRAVYATADLITAITWFPFKLML